MCYVTDRHGFRESAEGQEELLLEKIEAAAKAEVDWIQLREKDLFADRLAGLATEAIRLAAGLTATLINDRLDVAFAVKAAGVHLGEHGLPVSEAKRLVTERFPKQSFLVGASVHSLEAARRAERDGASYLIFGPVFATPSKAAFGAPQGLESLRQVCAQLTIPVLAIGGITPENIRECLDTGASGIAAIRLFQEAKDLSSVVRELRRAD